MNYDLIFFIIRVLTIIPLSYLVLMQGINLAKRIGGNGLMNTRITLLLLTLVFLCRQFIYFTADIHALFFNGNKHIWLSKAQPVFLVVNIAILYAVFRMYQLFTKNK